LNAANTRFVGDSSERPCAFTLRIFDSTGNVLVEDTKLLRALETAFIEVTGRDALAGRDSLRTEIWAAVSPSSAPRCPTAASFELIDNASGRTLVALGGPDTSQ
jgi:hypothetical protein